MEKDKRNIEERWNPYSSRTFTRADRKDSAAEITKSAITDHGKRESCHQLIWYQDRIQRKSPKDKTTQGINLHSLGYARRSTVATETGEPTTYQRPMTVFWSRVDHQHNATACLMKFADDELNIAIFTNFCAYLVV